MNLLKVFPWLASFIPSRWTVYLLLLFTLAGFGGGVWVTHKFEATQQISALNAARNAERTAALIGNQADTAYLNQLRKDKETNDAKIADLRRRLAAVPGCFVPVPHDWLRQPPGLPGTAAAAGSPGPAAAGVDTPAVPVASSADVVETCERNRLEVMEPNAQQIRALQEWYGSLRLRYTR